MNWVLKEIFTSPRTTQTTDSYSIKKLYRCPQGDAWNVCRQWFCKTLYTWQKCW